MAQLAIQGHTTRGSEVIALLEIMGGINASNYEGTNCDLVYHIINGYICPDFISIIKQDTKFIIYTLEEFEEKFPYKVGDMARLSRSNIAVIIKAIKWENDEIVYKLSCDDSGWWSVNNLKPYREKIMKDKPNLLQQLNDYFKSTPREVIEKEWREYDKYNEIGPKVNEYLEYVNNIRQPKYPKTFIEVLNFWHPDRQLEDDYQRCYKKDLIEKFQDLLYARDAYWKIAGEQMGLDKPWVPDWLNAEQDKYVLFTHNNAICSNRYVLGHNILAFPTEEMRDAFYENFKELIETCKELL